MKSAVNEIDDLLFKEDVYKIIGLAFKIYNKLGFGFHELTYHNAFKKEFAKNNIRYESEKRIKIYYDGEELSDDLIADLVYENKIIIELKSKTKLIGEDRDQLINYLKATGIELGLLINFGNRRYLEWKRVIFTDKTYIKNNNIPKIIERKELPND